MKLLQYKSLSWHHSRYRTVFFAAKRRNASWQRCYSPCPECWPRLCGWCCLLSTCWRCCCCRRPSRSPPARLSPSRWASCPSGRRCTGGKSCRIARVPATQDVSLENVSQVHHRARNVEVSRLIFALRVYYNCHQSMETFRV